jgi:MFS family permease
LAGFGVLMGAGISFGTIVPVATAVTRWFARYRGRGMALALNASGFAGFFASPVTNRILTANGGNWRQTWVIVAGVAVLSAIVAFFLVKERPEELGQLVDGGVSASAKKTLVASHAWTPRQAFATRSYWTIVLGGIGCQFPFFFFTAHWLLQLKGAGVSAADAAWAMGLFTMGVVAERWIGGWLMDLLPALFAFMLGLCCYFAGTALALRVNPLEIWIAYSAPILYGTGFGWTFVCMNTMTANFYGPAAFPKLNGTILMLTAIICSPAGVIGGQIFDRYGNYNFAFGINVAIAAMLFAKKPDAPETVTIRALELERAL